MERFNRTLFKGWVGLWIVMLVGIIALTPFSLLAIGVMCLFVCFLIWFGYFQVYPQICWDDVYDYGMAYNVIMFFGTMMAFILPCLYKIDAVLKWNNWCQWMVVFWLVSILLGIIAIYVKERKQMGKWKYAMVVVICLVAFTLLMACLGFFFNIYLT